VYRHTEIKNTETSCINSLSLTKLRVTHSTCAMHVDFNSYVFHRPKDFPLGQRFQLLRSHLTTHAAHRQWSQAKVLWAETCAKRPVDVPVSHAYGWYRWNIWEMC